MWSQRHDARAGLPSDTPLDQVGGGGWKPFTTAYGLAVLAGHCALLVLAFAAAGSPVNGNPPPACALVLPCRLECSPQHHPFSFPQLPLTMPSLDFALTWHTNPRKSPVVSFWRPLPPAGALGHVAVWFTECALLPTLVCPCCRSTRSDESTAFSSPSRSQAAAALTWSLCILGDSLETRPLLSLLFLSCLQATEPWAM